MVAGEVAQIFLYNLVGEVVVDTISTIRVAQKNRNAELRAGSLSGDARLVTDIKYINKNIYKSIHATQIEFLYFLYIAFTDYYSTAPCIRQITHRTQGIQLFPSVAGKLFYLLPPGAMQPAFSFTHTAHIKPHKARKKVKSKK